MNYKFKQQTKELVNRISMKLDIMRELERGNLELTRSILEARKLPQLKLRNRHRE